MKSVAHQIFTLFLAYLSDETIKFARLVCSRQRSATRDRRCRCPISFQPCPEDPIAFTKIIDTLILKSTLNIIMPCNWSRHYWRPFMFSFQTEQAILIYRVCNHASTELFRRAYHWFSSVFGLNLSCWEVYIRINIPRQPFYFTCCSIMHMSEALRIAISTLALLPICS